MAAQARLIAIIGTILVFTGVGIAAIQEDGFSIPTKIVAISGVALLLVSGLLAFGAIVAALRTRQGRYGMNVITGSISLLGIIVLVNLLGSRYFERSDLTKASKFSLAPQTHQVLGSLDAEATIYTFIPGDDPTGLSVSVRDLVREYDFASTRIRIREVDPAREPAITERLNIRPDVWAAVEVDGRVERLVREEAASEQRVTNAILRASNPIRKRVYLLAGHGERSGADDQPLGASEARRLLELENYDVGIFSFSELDSVPDDCAVVIALGPKVPLFSVEAERLMAYLERGGGLFLGVDPHFDADTLVDLGLDGLLATYGLRLGRGMVYDDSQAARQKQVGGFRPVANSYGTHPITAGFGDVYTVYQHVRPVWTESGRGRATIIVRTGSRTWEEMHPLVEDEAPSSDPGVDNAGPVPIVVAVSDRARRESLTVPDDPSRRVRTPETRLVVAGDSDFVTNVFIGVSTNRDLFLNAIAWLADEGDLVAVRARNPDNRPLQVSASQRNFLKIASLVLFPASALMAGVIAYLRRRRSDV